MLVTGAAYGRWIDRQACSRGPNFSWRGRLLLGKLRSRIPLPRGAESQFTKSAAATPPAGAVAAVRRATHVGVGRPENNQHASEGPRRVAVAVGRSPLRISPCQIPRGSWQAERLWPFTPSSLPRGLGWAAARRRFNVDFQLRADYGLDHHGTDALQG